MATTSQVRQLLAPTSLPAGLIDELLAQASAVWMMGEPAEVLAGDLVLCHPALALCEVRAVAKPTGRPSAWRLTVATQDRPGLLAELAGALAEQRLSITDASATVLPARGIALQRVTATHADGKVLRQADWDRVGVGLQAVLGHQEPVKPEFTPTPPVIVDAQPQDSGRMLVTVEAPDRVGLLWAVASWFAQRGCNVETCRATSAGGLARDTFVVVGDVDPTGLASALGGLPAHASTLPVDAVRVGVRLGMAAAATGVALGARIGRALLPNRPTRR
jgi:predicted amino acid-binding ACT domain protein